jgi:hypothetical protein
MKVRSTESDPSMVTITYNWQHDGHIPGSVRDMASSPISAGARNALSRLIENKMDWRSIKHLIRSDQRTLGNIMDSGAPLLESVRIDYNAVYYAMAKRMEKLANLDKNLASSLDLWKKEITDDGGHCFTRDLDSINSGMGVFVFGFCTAWQLTVSRFEQNDVSFSCRLYHSHCFRIGIEPKQAGVHGFHSRYLHLEIPG